MMQTLLKKYKWLLTISKNVRISLPGARNKIVITDENSQVCDHLVEEVERNFSGVIKKVIESQKPISVIVFNDVYIISLQN